MGSGSQVACSSWKAAGFHMRSGEFMRKQEHMLHSTSHTATCVSLPVTSTAPVFIQSHIYKLEEIVSKPVIFVFCLNGV